MQMNGKVPLPLAAALICAAIIAGGLSYVNTYKNELFPVAVPAQSGLVVAGPASSSTQQISSTTAQSPSTSTLSDAQILASSFIFIKPASASFTVPTSSLNNVLFTIQRVTKASGAIMAQAACPMRSSSSNNLFSQYLYSVNSCLGQNSSTIEGQPTALVAVDLNIENNTANQINLNSIFRNGVIMELFYTVTVDGADETRLAPIYLSASTMGHFGLDTLNPFSGESARIGFTVPESQNSFQLVYGYVGSGPTQGENFFGQAVGSFNIDFTNQTFSVTPG